MEVGVENQDISHRVLKDDTIIINPGKVLDNNNAHLMVEAINAAKAKGFKFIIMDMAKLEFLSSAGVGSILGNIETVRETGGDIILCNVPEVILHVLEVLDLADYFTIKPDEQGAATLCGIKI